MTLHHPVPGTHLLHIGDITVSFALLEDSLQSLVHAVLGSSQRSGQIVTAELPFRSLRALAVSLYLNRNGEDQQLEELREILKNVASCEDRRNQITHSIWGAGINLTTITRIKTTAKEKHGYRFQFEDITDLELAEIASNIRQVAEDLNRFQDKLIQSGKATNVLHTSP